MFCAVTDTYSPNAAIESATRSFNQRAMPETRPKQSKPPRPELPWQGRLYAIRVVFAAMALVMLVASDWSCHRQPAEHAWLILFGVVYPHLGHLLFGRFEGRGRRGYAVLVIDGLFCGAVMAAMGLAPIPVAVMAAINLFNWMVVGGPVLATFGMAATLTGIVLADIPAISPLPGTCMAADGVAGFLLIGYFLVMGRLIHRHTIGLRLQQLDFQAAADVASRARKLADQAMMSVLPRSAAAILAARGELPPETIDGATVLLVEFGWDRSQPQSIGDLANCFQISDAVIARHGFECVKTFGRRYLAMSRAPNGLEDAVKAVREINNYLLDHQSLPGSPAASRSLSAFVHCGALVAGLVQPSRLNFELLGEAIEGLDAISAALPGLPAGSIVASAAAQRRMPNTLEFSETPVGSGSTVYVLSLTSSP